ncbi:glycine--tRNA ligase subunit beta [Novosphingobium sp.]|uniref:glycine--tRNA ligase subunit beta n=1 Tax=Novosphingobium sp. TaxID=1874826 RepID=UPI002619051A|nr:glycine--tRNA ligase subunit beta [Novosphingobium sp.]
MTADFLLELRSEEIPARMQAGARADLEKLFRKELDAAGLKAGDITVWSTPRRLALIAKDLPLATEAVSEELKGPKTSAPEQALEGFLRKTGLTKDQLTERNGVWFAITEKPGRATKDVLAAAIPAIILAFPWPKSQRWGAASLSTESLRWVRPLSGIVAILGDELVECEIGGIKSGYATLGHRFHHHGEITIGGANDYAEKLRACHVIVDHAEREALIREKAKAAAQAAGLMLVEDEGLVIENAGLTEWPAPLLGRFDETFLEVPPEVIQLTARVNQKYFVCTQPSPLQGRGRSGEAAEGVGAAAAALADNHHPQTPSSEEEGAYSLANAFICTANIEATDGGTAIIDGNRKVLAARLSDARFFWEQDKKKPLSQHAEKLSRITFHEKLGTVADKVERVAKLARWLVEEGIIKPSPLQGRGLGVGAAHAALEVPHTPALSPEGERENAAKQPTDITGSPAKAGASGISAHPHEFPAFAGTQAELADQAELAARLCKADLVTEMVGEFPELQGLMGGYYARTEGLPDAVADAIRDHYKPVGQGDDVPTAPVTVAVALADKLDTLVGFFYVDEKPTGSKDPFALRRAALGVIRTLLLNGLRLSFFDLLKKHFDLMQRSAELAEERSLDRAKEAIGLPAGTIVITEGSNVECVVDLLTFFADRLKVQQREAGVRHDLIDAVFALGGEDDLVRLLARVHALQAFVTTEDGINLLAGYKRAANILKKEGFTPAPLPFRGGAGGGGLPDGAANGDSPHPNPSPEGEGLVTYAPEPAEQALIDALNAAEPQADTAIAAEDFTAAMAALASLRGPIDAFFDGVTVNDADPAKRTSRLALLDRFRAAVHKVADFSRIEG